LGIADASDFQCLCANASPPSSRGCSESLHFVGLAISAWPDHVVASPELHRRFKCYPESHSTTTNLIICMDIVCISASMTATAIPSRSPFNFCAHHRFIPYFRLPWPDGQYTPHILFERCNYSLSSHSTPRCTVQRPYPQDAKADVW
jgi:hypothetical protein